MIKPVLFSCFRSLERSENIHAIYKAYDGPKQLVNFFDRNYRAEVTSGKYNVMVIDDFPSCTPGKTILIDHSIHGCKTTGADQPGTPYYNGKGADKITYIASSGHGIIDIWQTAARVPRDRILPLGLPRTDQYIGKKKGDGHTVLASGFRSYLYVPTFRDKGETPLPDIDWDYIDDNLTNNELFAIKPHPWYYQYISQTILSKQYKHIIAIPGDKPSAQYLYDADVVITDYSSIMFDAYLLNKPVVLIEKIPGYLQTRGMYFKYPDEYSSRMARNEHELLHLLRYGGDTLTSIERNCIQRVADMCDGHSCERICNLINQLNGGDLL